MGTSPNQRATVMIKTVAVIYAALSWSLAAPVIKRGTILFSNYIYLIMSFMGLSVVFLLSGLFFFAVISCFVFSVGVIKFSLKNVGLLLLLWCFPALLTAMCYYLNLSDLGFNYYISAWVYRFVILAALTVQLHKHGGLRGHRKLLIFYVSSVIPAVVFGMGEPFYPI
ncbi:hypothetical protein FACS1894120_4390 [Clostridia bacterium]|nr:hypothetical protein FACS1894120_4390 [Clostridia bacterium]